MGNNAREKRAAQEEQFAAIFARLRDQDIEQFYANYQLWVLRRRVPLIEQQLETMREHLAEHQLVTEALRPSALALAVLVRLQSSGVSDTTLLDTMLERGEDWLDRMMQRLDYCEQVQDFIQGDYTQWCVKSLDGAYDWIDSLLGSIKEEPVSHENASNDSEATEELLLHKLSLDDEKAMLEFTFPQAPVEVLPENDASTHISPEQQEPRDEDTADPLIQDLPEQSPEFFGWKDLEDLEAPESLPVPWYSVNVTENGASSPTNGPEQSDAMDDWIHILQTEAPTEQDTNEVEAVAENALATPAMVTQPDASVILAENVEIEQLASSQEPEYALASTPGTDVIPIEETVLSIEAQADVANETGSLSDLETGVAPDTSAEITTDSETILPVATMPADIAPEITNEPDTTPPVVAASSDSATTSQTDADTLQLAAIVETTADPDNMAPEAALITRVLPETASATPEPEQQIALPEEKTLIAHSETTQYSPEETSANVENPTNETGLADEDFNRESVLAAHTPDEMAAQETTPTTTNDNVEQAAEAEASDEITQHDDISKKQTIIMNAIQFAPEGELPQGSDENAADPLEESAEQPAWYDYLEITAPANPEPQSANAGTVSTIADANETRIEPDSTPEHVKITADADETASGETFAGYAEVTGTDEIRSTMVTEEVAGTEINSRQSFALPDEDATLPFALKDIHQEIQRTQQSQPSLETAYSPAHEVEEESVTARPTETSIPEAFPPEQADATTPASIPQPDEGDAGTHSAVSTHDEGPAPVSQSPQETASEAPEKQSQPAMAFPASEALIAESTMRVDYQQVAGGEVVRSEVLVRRLSPSPQSEQPLPVQQPTEKPGFWQRLLHLLGFKKQA